MSRTGWCVETRRAVIPRGWGDEWAGCLCVCMYVRVCVQEVERAETPLLHSSVISALVRTAPEELVAVVSHAMN